MSHNPKAVSDIIVLVDVCFKTELVAISPSDKA